MGAKQVDHHCALQMKVIAGQTCSCWPGRTRWTKKVRASEPLVLRLTADNRRTDSTPTDGWTRRTTQCRASVSPNRAPRAVVPAIWRSRTRDTTDSPKQRWPPWPSGFDHFRLAGSLCADREHLRARQVDASRADRLTIPFWLMTAGENGPVALPGSSALTAGLRCPRSQLHRSVNACQTRAAHPHVAVDG
jgi:hypothetical protein